MVLYCSAIAYLTWIDGPEGLQHLLCAFYAVQYQGGGGHNADISRLV
jgi:hypothetical protein